ncbi:MAG: hypothetical protein HZA08_13945 [Nitrospirae bacterium]|nr:hypothetical protein [Nitrospirota bacterium]
MMEETVYVEPILITFNDLKSLYEVKKDSIQHRIDELRKGWNKSNEGVFAELCYCILIAGTGAEKTLQVVTGLEKEKLLFHGTKQKIDRYISENNYGVSDKKVESILKWRKQFSNNGSIRIKQVLENRFLKQKVWDIHGAREYLVSLNEEIGKMGIRWKVASQFLRNVGIGLGHDIAVLDTHIRKDLDRLEYINDINSPSLSKEKYLEFEIGMINLARDTGIPMDDLDFLLWSNHTGMIIK